jgi:quinol monooxygenase YgiN
MVIVAGHIEVASAERESYLAGCVSLVEAARRAPGCLDFSIAADLAEAGRINIYERWDSQSAVEDFRGSGPTDEQSATILAAAVAEYDVAAVRDLM